MKQWLFFALLVLFVFMMTTMSNSDVGVQRQPCSCIVLSCVVLSMSGAHAFFFYHYHPLPLYRVRYVSFSPPRRRILTNGTHACVCVKQMWNLVRYACFMRAIQCRFVWRAAGGIWLLAGGIRYLSFLSRIDRVIRCWSDMSRFRIRWW